MTRAFLALLSLACAVEAAPSPPFSAPPKTWIDPQTGHRVLRLTDEPGSASLYFNINAFTPDGRQMIYTAPVRSIGVIDLTTFKSRLILRGDANAAGPGTIEVGRRTGLVYFNKDTADPAQRELWTVDIATGKERKLARLPRRAAITSINADETLAAGTLLLSSGSDYRELRSPRHAHSSPVDKHTAMAQRLAEHLPMEIFTVDLKTGAIKTLLRSTDWLDHLQFSPTDPTLLLYAHQGAWNQVDKLWLVRTTDPARPWEIASRIMIDQGVGHQWWDTQNDVWYDQHFPLGGDVSYVCSWNVPTGTETWYHYQPNEASIHFNRSADGRLFCGDGGFEPGGQWITLFRPQLIPDDHTQIASGARLIQPGILHAERLVNLSRHNYHLEPNVRFTPDAKYVIFRSNMFGPTYVFAVEVAKAAATR